MQNRLQLPAQGSGAMALIAHVMQLQAVKLSHHCFLAVAIALRSVQSTQTRRHCSVGAARVHSTSGNGTRVHALGLLAGRQHWQPFEDSPGTPAASPPSAAPPALQIQLHMAPLPSLNQQTRRRWFRASGWTCCTCEAQAAQRTMPCMLLATPCTSFGGKVARLVSPAAW